MAERTQLGIFWGEKAFSLVQVSKGQLTAPVQIPFDAPLEAEMAKDVPEGLRLTAQIQQAMRKHNVAPGPVVLSLPAKDLIFRSFAIPWMKPEEVKSVVDFEITKYIPIKLDQLSYTFHAVPYTENNQKNLRIIFVAARKNIIERYTGILDHTQLPVAHIEPASVSMIRALKKQGLISGGQTIAIIMIKENGGEIIITEDEVVKSVREFQTAVNASNAATLGNRFFNDVRVSLNFYSRQNPPGVVNKIITIANSNLESLSQDLSKDLNIPVTSLLAAKIMKTEKISDLGLLYAYGGALRDKEFSPKDFELSDRARKMQRLGEMAKVRFKQYQIMGGVLAGCAVVAYLTILLSNNLAVGHRKRLAELKEKQSTFTESKTDDILAKKSEVSTKLASYKDIRIKSDVAYYMAKVPELLPKGTWLKNLDFQYYIKAVTENDVPRSLSVISVSMEGYVYKENANEQFRLVNSLVARLKEDKEFAKEFTDIDLSTVRQDNLNNVTVTYFKITCR